MMLNFNKILKNIKVKTYKQNKNMKILKNPKKYYSYKKILNNNMNNLTKQL